MIIAGIDPGKTGALVLLFPDNSVLVNRVPLMTLRGKEQPAWSEWADKWGAALDSEQPDRIVIEQIAARPTQGVTSMFNFGVSYGFVRCIAEYADVPIHFVTPAVWKAKLSLLNSDKNASREMARRLMPSIAKDVARVKDDGVAEAALLAYYGRMHL
jgi:crossover junction endodeoxyribonuclease RuvC